MFWPTLCQASAPNNTEEHCCCCFSQSIRLQPRWTGQKASRAGPIIFSGLEQENLTSRDINLHVLSPNPCQLLSLLWSHLTSELPQEVGSILFIVWVRKLRLREIRLTKLMQFTGGNLQTHSGLSDFNVFFFTIPCGLIQIPFLYLYWQMHLDNYYTALSRTSVGSDVL